MNEGTPKQKVITREVYYNGENKRTRMNGTTGVMSFNQREEAATYFDGKPIDAKVPSFIGKANKKLYTPQNDKFDGYS